MGGSAPVATVPSSERSNAAVPPAAEMRISYRFDPGPGGWASASSRPGTRQRQLPPEQRALANDTVDAAATVGAGPATTPTAWGGEAAARAAAPPVPHPKVGALPSTIALNTFARSAVDAGDPLTYHV